MNTAPSAVNRAIPGATAMRPSLIAAIVPISTTGRRPVSLDERDRAVVGLSQAPRRESHRKRAGTSPVPSQSRTAIGSRSLSSQDAGDLGRTAPEVARDNHDRAAHRDRGLRPMLGKVKGDFRARVADSHDQHPAAAKLAGER